MTDLIARVLSVCIHRAWFVVALAIVFGAAMTYYVVGNFAMTTDISALLSPKLAWRVQETAFDTAFPSDGSNIVVVIDGQTPELSGDSPHVLGRSKEQSVVGPEWSRVRSLDRVEQVRLGAQTLGEPSGSLLAQFGCLTVDNHDDIGTV